MTLKYQWLRSGLAIAGATGSTYVESAADLGKLLSVRVTGSKTGYGTAARTSKTTTAVAAGILTAPIPTVSGSVKVGSSLIAIPGSWEPVPVTLTYQWLRTGIVIAGATGSSYTPKPGDLAAQVSLRVTGTKTGYTTQTRTAATAAAVAAGTLSAATPVISGTAQVAGTLTVATGAWTAGTSYTYQWSRNGMNIPGATGGSYMPEPADIGAQISVNVTGSNIGYATLTRTSTVTPAVTPGILTAPTPTITGTAKVGTTLTAVPGTWEPAPVSLTYQWNADGLAIMGANSATYIPIAADAGKTIAVTVTGAKSGYTTVGKTSAPTATVAALPAGVIRVSGSIDHDTTWSVDEGAVYLLTSPVTISAGATLFVEPGVVVKGGLTVHGTLKAEGTAASPVIFTSHSDDSAGGDSNGDGPTPATDQGSLLRVYETATIVLSRVRVDHSGQLADWIFPSNGKKASLQITDSELNTAVNVSRVNPVLERNRIHSHGRPGLSASLADISGIALSGPNTNTFSGTARERAVYLVNSSIPATAILTWNQDSNVSAFIGEAVDVQGSLTLTPGVVVKAQLTVRGVLKAEGTAASPVIFTSDSDDSAGGDSNGDGPTPATDRMSYSPLRVYETATIVLSRVRVDHSDQLADWIFPSNGKKASLQITDSELNTAVNVSRVNPVLERNRIHSHGRPGLSASRVDINGIALSGPNTNTLSGTAQERAVYLVDSSIPVGAAVTWNQDSNVSAFIGSVPYVQGSLSVEPGVVVKATLTVSGTLTAEGTAVSPVTFTSDSDDSAGGDTNGDGPTPTTDKFSPLRVETSAAIVLSHVRADNSHMLFDWIFDVAGKKASLQITDSELNTAVNVASANRPVLERNRIHNRDRGQAGLTTYRIDVSGIALSGPDTNTLTGTAVERTVRFHESSIPAGVAQTWNHDSNASAFVGNANIGGSLSVAPGVVVKAVLTVWGTLKAEGTALAPVVFTSDSDDSAGGDSNGDGGTTATDQPWQIVTAGAATIVLSHVRVDHNRQLIDWRTQGQAISLRITDSELNTAVNIQSTNRPVLERNRIHNRDRGQAGLTTYRVDVSGIALSGPNTNILSGTAAERAVRFGESTIPAGVAQIWNQDSNVSAFLGSTYVQGSLNLTPGVVVKARLTVYGTLKAEGTAASPVIFTSDSDDSAGGDSNGNGPTPVTNQNISVRLETGSKDSSFTHALFMRSTTAISVGEFIALSVDKSKFVNTNSAFQVDGAAHFDQTLSVYYSLLPCAPPYDSLVNVRSTWFGSLGFPGADVDVTSFAGMAIDDPLIGGLYDMASGQAPLTGSLGTNTRPWAAYSCTPGKTPGDAVSFPVTPVVLDTTSGLPPEPWIGYRQD